MAELAVQHHTRVRERQECGLCGSRALQPVWSFGSTPPANNYLRPEEVGAVEEIFAPLDVVRCEACAAVQLRHIVDPHILFDAYLYVSSTTASFRQHFADYAQQLIDRFALTANSLVVDIGSNDGVLLHPLRQHSVRVLGVEPAANIAAQANAAGIPTIAEFFTLEVAARIMREYGQAQVISANNVFAHTDDIASFVEAVKTLLAPEGAYVFEVQYLQDLVEKNLFDIVYHEHLYYYHVAPLKAFFERHAMEIFEVQRVPVHGGSIRVFVQHKGGPHPVSPDLATLLADEAYLNTTTPYQEFAKRVAQNKTALQELIRDLKQDNATIAGYGAPAKATTLLYAFGLSGKDIDFIVDDAPLKQGRVMPGLHIPIVGASALYGEEPHFAKASPLRQGLREGRARGTPDYCIILAWNFADAIMQQHQRFTEQGGKFIIPVPTPRIV